MINIPIEYTIDNIGFAFNTWQPDKVTQKIMQSKEGQKFFKDIEL